MKRKETQLVKFMQIYTAACIVEFIVCRLTWVAIPSTKTNDRKFKEADANPVRFIFNWTCDKATGC